MKLVVLVLFLPMLAALGGCTATTADCEDPYWTQIPACVRVAE